jgi:hypothetical protein
MIGYRSWYLTRVFMIVDYKCNSVEELRCVVEKVENLE